MLKRTFKILAIVLILAIVGIQFIRPDFNNPPTIEGERLHDVNAIPGEVASVLKRSCADCHSNETVYPWYSKVAPLSWGMADHISEARKELNFSVWKTYSEKRRIRKLKQMCREVEAGTMPYYQYLWLHWDAGVSDAEKRALCKWTKTVIEEAGKEGKS